MVATLKRASSLARVGAAQHPKILATYGGEYSNPKLERMVAGIVGKLVTVSDNPGEVYQITILNSPNVNAFALPGGHIVFFRGLIDAATAGRRGSRFGASVELRWFSGGVQRLTNVAGIVGHDRQIRVSGDASIYRNECA